MIVWICGKINEEGCCILWEFQGVFDEEDKAVDACRSERYFVGPATLNEPLPDETVEWIGCYFPKQTRRTA